jgi:tRNA (guanosine-2'-O-)-methyltransferase
MSRCRQALAVSFLHVTVTGCSADIASRSEIPSSKVRSVASDVTPRAGEVLGKACVTTGPEQCFNARDDNCNGALDEGCGLTGGVVQFMIAWNGDDADVDLNVIDPHGELAEVARVTRSGLTKERDCPGKDNECRGVNVENVVLDREDALTRGTYSVRIRLERARKLHTPVKVNFAARLGPKTYATEVELRAAQDERRIELTL